MAELPDPGIPESGDPSGFWLAVGLLACFAAIVIAQIVCLS